MGRTAAAIVINEALLRRWPLPLPEGDGDKEDRGRVLVVGGSREMPGAIILAGIAAMRAGAGKLTIATSARAAPLVAQAVCEARVIALDETRSGAFVRVAAKSLPDDSSALLIGPGMTDSAGNRAFVSSLLERASAATAVVLDAGAMDVVRARPRSPRSRVGARASAAFSPLLLTPHAGELAHLSGASKDAILAEPASAVRAAARKWYAIVALKGAIT